MAERSMAVVLKTSPDRLYQDGYILAGNSLQHVQNPAKFFAILVIFEPIQITDPSNFARKSFVRDTRRRVCCGKQTPITRLSCHVQPFKASAMRGRLPQTGIDMASRVLRRPRAGVGCSISTNARCYRPVGRGMEQYG